MDPGKVEKLGDYKGVTFTPLSTEVTDQDVEDVILAVKKICEYYRKS